MATPTINTDYLKFDAFSVKNLIKQKLSEDPTFTDYVYDDSNLSILIDIFSNMFQVLLYNLNHTAAESMFTDTQIYENMNRLVKFIGYNPRGYNTSNVTVNLTYPTSGYLQGVILPTYSSVKLNKTDKNGNSIYYSTVEHTYLYGTDSTTENTFNMYNGEWTKYPSTFIAEGIPYEKFTLDAITADSTGTTPTYISYPYIHIYIKRKNNSSDNSYETIRYDPNIDGLFINTKDSSIYGPTSKIFNLRLNEYKQYEIQFGDGIHGESVQKGDIITVVYLNSNGPDGLVDVNEITSDIFINTSILNINNTSVDNSILSMDDIIYCLYKDSINTYKEGYSDLYVENIYASSTPTNEETVDDIKTNAPQWFKSIGRAITQKDFEFFIKSRYYNDVVDVKVMNNWEYVSTFYKWLYMKGVSSKVNPSSTKYINSGLYTNYGYKYSDAADSNNVYIWIKAKNNIYTTLFESIDKALRPIKPLTAEPVFMTPVRKIFFPCAYIYERNASNYNIDQWDPQVENYIEIEIDKNTPFAFNSIKNIVTTYITDFFKTTSQTIGGIINTTDLTSQILSISGVKGIKTVFVDSTDSTNMLYKNGLSFACWTPDIINGEDIDLTNSSYVLEPFQFAELASSAILSDHIKIITESAYHTNQVEY